MTLFRYDLFGLTFASDIAIPWAPPSAEACAPDVTISCRAAQNPGPDSMQFEVPEVGRYAIMGGRAIAVAPLPGVSEDAIRLYLLGSALGVLLHQRGLLVLHANAVVVEGGAALFMGPSGAGKSTLAAWFARRGLPVLTDDICALDVSAGGAVAVLPGLTRLRLADEAAARLEVDVGGGVLCPSSGKYEIAVPHDRPRDPVPLRACYLLADGGTEAGPSVRRLASLDSVEMLMANTYRGFALRRLGGSAAHLSACMAAATAAPCFEARRTKDWRRFDTVAEALLAHVRANGARRQSDC